MIKLEKSKPPALNVLLSNTDPLNVKIVLQSSKIDDCGHAGDRNRDLPQIAQDAKRMLYH